MNDFENIYKVNIEHNNKEEVYDTYDDIISQGTAYFNVYHLITDMYHSYKNDITNVYLQFIQDFPRQDIFLNGIKYDDHVDFLEMIYNENMYDKFMSNSKEDIIILLCTQTFFYIPYLFLRKIYNLEDNDNYVLTSGTGHETYIQINDDITIDRKANFYIKNIEKDIIEHEIIISVYTTFFKQNLIEKMLYPDDMQIFVLNWTTV